MCKANAGTQSERASRCFRVSSILHLTSCLSPLSRLSPLSPLTPLTPLTPHPLSHAQTVQNPRTISVTQYREQSIAAASHPFHPPTCPFANACRPHRNDARSSSHPTVDPGFHDGAYQVTRPNSMRTDSHHYNSLCPLPFLSPLSHAIPRDRASAIMTPSAAKLR
jgi:hypothetical protein